MFSFYLRRALHSLRRTPVLTAVMIIDVALGLAVWTLAYTAVDAQQRYPAERARNVYHVDWGTLPSFDPQALDQWQGVLSVAPHLLLSYGDAERLSRHPTVARHAKTFTSQISLDAPTGRHCVTARFATHTLFDMFELDFAAGQAWSAADEDARRDLVVIDAGTRRMLFGGGQALGRELSIDGRAFRVAGVLKETPQELRAYDFSFDTSPAIYLPMALFAELGARPSFATHGLQRDQTMAQLLESQVGFVQLWVELPNAAAQSTFAGFVRAVARERGIAGAERRPLLMTPSEFVQTSVPVSGGFLLFEACAFLALLACGVNLSRLLIVKLEARAPELALQRALGATRGSVFAQHMLEALMVGALATALGLGIAMLGLVGFNAVVPDRPVEFAIDGSGAALTCAAGLLAAMLAGALPGLRVCRAAPASRLRLM
jgi:putative ABC transport system permease protein